MKLLNEDNTDFSNEIMVQLAIMLECTYAAELIAYRVSRDLDNSRIKETLFQKKKQLFNRARTKTQEIIRDLEVSLDGTFADIQKRNFERFGNTDYVQGLANDILQVLLIYYARSDGDPETRKRMKKALANFKPNPEIDLGELMKYYKFEI